MADPEEPAPEGVDDSAEPGGDARAEGKGVVDKCLDMLLPSGSFEGPDAAANLAGARCMMCVFYLIYTGVLFYMIYQLIFSGKIEVYQTMYKFDRIEAPSFAICPFNPDVSVKVPDNQTVDKHVTAKIYNTNGFRGFTKLSIAPQGCYFDRSCVCVDYASSPGKQYFQDHKTDTGGGSLRNPNFRDRIEVQTNLTDSSGEQALKIGLYGSADRSPEWFYVGQGNFVLGTVELREWIVNDYTMSAVWKTVHGDWTAMFQQRRMYHFMGEPVGRAANQTENQTIFSYEMKDFFVPATMSSSSSISLFTLGYLIILISVRHAVVGLFVWLMFPEYDPKKDEVKVREMSGLSDCLMTCCCCCCRRRGGNNDEREPLLAAETGAEAPAETAA